MRVIALVGLLTLLGLAFASPALATTYTVTNTGDSGAGSLRAAITAANNDATPPATIAFAPSVTQPIIITSGPLAITNSMTINGPGASTLELDGNGGEIQILTISSHKTVSISGLTFAFGGSSGDGGAIDNSGTLTLSNDVFDHNSAGGPGGSADYSGAGSGGAIASSGSLTVANSTFADNTAGGNGGGGVFSGEGDGGAIFSSGSLAVTGSTFTANSAGGNGGSNSFSGDGIGGAIDNDGSSMILINSTLTANRAGGSAGSSGLSGDGQGGALEVQAPATLSSDTIDANSVGTAAGARGSGIDLEGTSLTSIGSIVSGNAGAPNCNNANGTISATDSLEGPSGQTSCGFDLPSADPLLGPLTDNGGPTETQALTAGGPAIGAVTAAGACPATDQRGSARASGHCDAGAYEVAPPVSSSSRASSIGTTTASLAGEVANPDVQAGTVMFQYGTSSSYGSATTAQTLPANSSATYVASLIGLTPGGTYHFRVVAQDPDGTVYGPDQILTTETATAPSPSPSPSPAPPAAPPSNLFSFGKTSVASGGKITLPVNALNAGRFTGKATFAVATHKGKKRVTTTFTYGTASVTSTGHGTFKLVIGLSPRAARELKLLGTRQVTIAVKFTPDGGTARTESKRLTITRSRSGKYS